jgi:3-oxoadipate enol-lactonase
MFRDKGWAMRGTFNGRAFGGRLVLGLIALVLGITVLLGPNSALANPGDQPAPGAFIDVDGAKLYYEECGSGPEAVVLIHDGILHSVVWDGVWGSFCNQFHVIRYDRRGYGRSEAGTKLYFETDDIFALLRHLKVSRAMLVGSSHGGELAIDFTLEHPNLVEQLVLVGAVVSGYHYSDHFYERGQANSQPLEKNDVAGAITNWTNDRYLIAPGHDAARKNLHDLLTANPQDLSHPDWAKPLAPALPRLSQIRLPTLILVGDADIPDVHAHAGVIEVGIPNSRRVVIKDTGHLMYLEKPEEFSRIVISFLQANRY